MISKPEILLDIKADLAEGPAWSVKERRLYWVDIRQGNLHVYDPREKKDRAYSVGESIGCAAPRRRGGLVLGLKSSIVMLEALPEEAGPVTVRTVCSPEAGNPGNRFNDGKCDPAGRFLAGSMDNAEVDASGSLYSLAPDGQVNILLGGLRISNGLAWSPDHKTFYFIDTPTHLVMAYDYDLASGRIANPRVAVTVPAEMGWPDGMTSDIEGMLWVALWGGAALTRWNPATGRLLKAIPFPALNVSACAFGGAEMNEIYVTTARKGMTEAQLAKYPGSGGIFRLKTNIQGMPTFEFAG